MNPAAFRPTRWTLVQRTRGHDEQARAALSELCEIYYQPVLSFIEHRIRDPDSTRDLAHAFFEDLLARETLGAPDPDRGRFRTYLLGAVKHFLAKQHQKDQAAKRGGGIEHTTADLLQIPAAPDDDLQFDRAWAHALIRRAHSSLEGEMAAAGKHRQFEILHPFLDGGPQTSHEEACAALGFSANALNVAIHRLRERFRAHVRTEVAATTSNPADLQDEFHHLLEVLLP
jgi:DNA-directed RNA polymerase specialized sigma24 family protein